MTMTTDRLKESLRSKCLDVVELFLIDIAVQGRDFKTIINAIHTSIVSDAVDALQPNCVLNAPPPLIDPSEATLPCATRSTLAQLRSGHCAKLNSYLFHLGRSDSDLCPDCQADSHTSDHLFACPSNPTALSTTDLWEKPWDVASFLSSLRAFDSIPDPGPPPPPRFRPRRRPPPAPRQDRRINYFHELHLRLSTTTTTTRTSLRRRVPILFRI